MDFRSRRTDLQSLNQVWTLWGSFVFFYSAADNKQTNKQTDRRSRTSYPRRSIKSDYYYFSRHCQQARLKTCIFCISFLAYCCRCPTYTWLSSQTPHCFSVSVPVRWRQRQNGDLNANRYFAGWSSHTTGEQLTGSAVRCPGQMTSQVVQVTCSRLERAGNFTSKAL